MRSSLLQLYRKKLIDKHFSNIDTIEQECLTALHYLSNDTHDKPPVKGLIVGYVQSGKTANMAGIMSMRTVYGFRERLSTELILSIYH